jgi:tetratricopeptide (TPR) repeat protein
MADSAAPAAGRIFISYRREETAYAAGWLFDRLADRFGRGQIFKDVDSIQLGDDFVAVITTAVDSCDVLLALIGDQWLTISDEQGRPRLANPNDFVRLEIEAALTRNVRVIPILVEEARMPDADELPPSLAKLARRQALELSPARFEFDTSRLLNVLERALAGVRAQPTVTGPAAAVPTQQARLRALYVEARAEIRLGHFQTAIDLLDDLLAIDPSHRDVARLREDATQQLHLAKTYQRAVDAEAASEWTDAANAYAEILGVDATYRDAAARLEVCKARQQVLDLQAEIRHHAAAGQWQAVLAVNAELDRLDPAASDPDGLATQAQHALEEKKRADERAVTVAESAHPPQPPTPTPASGPTRGWVVGGAAAGLAGLLAGLLAWHPWPSPTPSPTPTATATGTGGKAGHASSWQQLPPLPIAVEGAGAASYGGKLWVVGGNSSNEGHDPLASVEVYDPATGHWSQGPSLPEHPVGEAGVVSTGGSLYVIGGQSATNKPVTDVWRLDDPKGNWIHDVDLPGPRVSGAAAFDGTQIVFAGGIGPDIKDHGEIFTLRPGSAAWQTANVLPQPRDNFAAASDGNGSVWFMGGSYPDRQHRHREVVLLKNGSVTKVADLSVAIRALAAVWWPGAGACAIGGDGNSVGSVQCVAQPVQAWHPPPLSHPRGGLAAAVVGDRVYTAGGYFGTHPASEVTESIALH